MPTHLAHRHRSGGFTLVELMIVIAIIGALATIMVPNFRRSRAMTQFTSCKANLKNIATSVELYSADSHGRYPVALSLLTASERYLRVVPTCPSAGSDTYSSTFSATTKPDNFTLYCSGNHHAEVDAGANYPQYSSLSGIIEK